MTDVIRRPSGVLQRVNEEFQRLRDQFRDAQASKDPAAFKKLIVELGTCRTAIGGDIELGSADRKVFEAELDALTNSASKSAENLTKQP